MEILRSNRPDNIIDVIDVWQENNDFVYVQMELASCNLAKVLRHKRMSFGRDSEDGLNILNSLEFYLSCQMFREVTQGIHSLHCLQPPVIHRDLKPENVLLCEPSNGTFLKITDFDLSTFYEKSSNTGDKGDRRYMAPEVRDGKKYNFKADIYSLGIIGYEIFDR